MKGLAGYFRLLAKWLAALLVVAAWTSPVLAKDAIGRPLIVNLWPGPPPGSGAPKGPEKIGNEGSAVGAYSNISVPRIEIYRPERPNGTAILIAAGGGYFRIQIGSAAMPLAQYLLKNGVTPIILYYRLPGDGWNADAPFQDGQRALRLLRARAADYGIASGRIGMIGFSAGGHLTGMMATRGAQNFYAPLDAVDSQSAIPDFAGMIYPVVSLRPPIDTTRTRRELSPLPDAVNAYSVEALVSDRTPPVFLAHAADDPIADVQHSLRMFAAMRERHRDVELHIFEKGGHSWGIGPPGSLVSAWPALFLKWCEAHHWLAAPSPAK